MTELVIPNDFIPADPGLCNVAEGLKGKTSARFIAVYRIARLIAVHDGTSIDLSRIKPDDAAGKSLLRCLSSRLRSGGPIALLMDLRESSCWLTSREQALVFVKKQAALSFE